MTSANVIEYIIFDKENNQVGYHRQNIMCLTNNDGLEKFTPPSDYSILPYGYDENEEYWEGEKQNLMDWLIKNKAHITLKNFQPNESVNIKKIGKGQIIKRYEIGKRRNIKMNWFPVYEVKLENEEIIIIDQNQIIP